MDLTLNRRKVFLIALLIWGGIYLPSLGTLEFKGEEGRRVLPAVTMLETGNWIVPSVGGESYYSKPPGINWVVAISFMLSGLRTELTARLPSVIFILFFVSLLIWMQCPWLSLSGRLISAIIFLTSIAMMEKGRLIEIEAVYISLAGIAMLWWLNTWSMNGSQWSLWIIPCGVLGFGLLVKGPFILIFFYCTVVAVLLYSKRFNELFSIQHILGFVVILILTLGWAYLAYQQGEGSKMTNRMVSQFLVRIIVKPNFVRWGWSIVRAFGNFLPWVLFVPILWDKNMTLHIKQEHIALFKGCRLGLVISFAIINLMPGVQSRYSMPVFPLASVLLGWVLSISGGAASGNRVWRNLLLASFAVSCVTAGVGLVFVTVGPAAIVISALTVCCAIASYRSRIMLDSAVRLSLIQGVLSVVIVLQYVVFVVPIQKKYEYRRPSAFAVNNIVPSHETIYAFKPGYQAFLFYIRPPIKYVFKEDDINKEVQYLILEESVLETLKTQANVAWRSPKILYEFPEKKNLHGRWRLVKLE